MNVSRLLPDVTPNLSIHTERWSSIKSTPPHFKNAKPVPHGLLGRVHLDLDSLVLLP